MIGASPHWELALALLLLALTPLGPLPLAMRAMLHPFFGTSARRYWPAAAAGTLGGLAAAILLTTWMGWLSPIIVMVLGLLLLLAIMDMRWRWLPLEWCALIGVATLAQAIANGAIGAALIAMVLPAATLAAIRAIFLWMRGIEVIGAGDLWLIAALSGQIGVQGGALMLGLAAVSGLASHLIYKAIRPDGPQRYGVAYGAHLCANFVLVGSLTAAI
ncbi:MAG: hypothetical protein AAF919_14755 [Pseudomonadota bacterium]